MNKKVYIRVTNGCNLQCKHCYLSEDRDCGEIQYIDTESCIKYLKLLISSKNYYEISFHGGEPFLNEKTCQIMEDIMNALKDYDNLSFDATTNLMIKHPKIMDYLLRFLSEKKFSFKNRPFLKISWDAGKLRYQTKSQEDLVLGNIKLLKKKFPDIYIKANICLTEELFSVSAKTLVEKLPVDEWHFERLTGDLDFIPSYDDVDLFLCYLYKYKEYHGIPRVDNFDAIHQGIYGNYLGCAGRKCMYSVLTINPDMSIGGCPNTAYNTNTKKNYSNFKKLIKQESIPRNECLACEYFKICNGDCFQLEWQGDRCPAPKRLMEMILDDVAGRSE